MKKLTVWTAISALVWTPAAVATAATAATDTAIAPIALSLLTPEAAGSAGVATWDGQQQTVVREGKDFLCVIDRSRPARLGINCHHDSLRRQIALEREVAADGFRGAEFGRRLCEQVEERGVRVPNGAIEISTSLALGEDGALPELMRLYYLLWMPFSTTASVGISDEDPEDDTPWLHMAGTCQAHLMWFEERATRNGG